MKDTYQHMKPIIQNALEEDIGDGDVTTDCIVPGETVLTGQFKAKAKGIAAGLEVVAMTFSLLDDQTRFTPMVTDGAPVIPGQVIAGVEGPGRTLLGGERVALNLFQRMSGIATLTHRFVEAVKGTKVIILDTRKTVPGLRYFDKWAVRLGGGQNHRFGLFDMVMIKDNHITAAGGITEAVNRVRAGDRRKRAIEVEVKSLEELRETLPLNVNRILLDNMDHGEMRRAVDLTKGRTKLEASGNITLENAAEVAATGVDYISVGALTHSVQALDISLLLN
ncbi:MAG: carboxylating nicotinate-nucleotide diphosphorylase [bacterium]|nr:carboxylating nicotinate-nucleotide diphosphorylase [bacterium]